MAKEKRLWGLFDTRPLYVLHLFLLAWVLLLAHFVGGFIGIESITNKVWLYTINALYYFLWAYLYDNIYHKYIGGD